MQATTEFQNKKSPKDTAAISISGLSKKFLIGSKQKGTLAETLTGFIGINNNSKEEFLALDDINLEIRKGEVIGIIGKNGAGKSTLLKILSRITQPSKGKIEINGRVASLLEVGTGFHPELTGRENIYLNGTILGMSRKEVKEKFDRIIEFSGVEKFVDTPVKHYSSGMYVRLAFAVAAHLDPEILIVDEVLAVGDSEFQKKCLGKMREVANEGRTVIFVSHQLSSILNLCKTGLLLQNGRMVAYGDIHDVVAAYTRGSQFKKFVNLKDDNPKANNGVFLSSIEFLTKAEKATIQMGEDLNVIVDVYADEAITNCHLNIRLNDEAQYKLAAWRTSEQGTSLQLKKGSNKVQLRVKAINVFNGNYSLSIAILHGKELMQLIDDALFFEIIPSKIPLFGDKLIAKKNTTMYTPCEWSLL